MDTPSVVTGLAGGGLGVLFDPFCIGLGDGTGVPNPFGEPPLSGIVFFGDGDLFTSDAAASDIVSGSAGILCSSLRVAMSTGASATAVLTLSEPLTTGAPPLEPFPLDDPVADAFDVDDIPADLEFLLSLLRFFFFASMGPT